MVEKTEEAEDTEKHGARVVKTLILSDAQSNELGVDSKQIRDPFANLASYGKSIVKPPFNFDHLLQLAESQPVHAAAIEQKVTDVKWRLHD